MNSTTQLEQFQKRKAELRSELQSMEGRERTLVEGLRILEEKLGIQELEEKIKAKRAVVERLEFKKRDMERRLKEPQKKEPLEIMVKVASSGDQQSEKQEKKKPLPALLEKLS